MKNLIQTEISPSLTDIAAAGLGKVKKIYTQSIDFIKEYPKKIALNAILLTAITTTTLAGIIESYRDGYLGAKELLDKNWPVEKVERAYQSCLSEMPFYWDTVTKPGRYIAYNLHGE